MFKDLGIELESTNDKEKIKQAENFIATFTPDSNTIIIR